MLAWLKSCALFFRNRALEVSTWKDVGVAIGAAAVLPAPWSYYMFAVSLAGALVKDWTLGQPK